MIHDNTLNKLKSYLPKLFQVLVLLLIGCETKDEPLNQLLREGSPSFLRVLNDPKHEVQIIYGEIVEDSVIHHYFNHHPYNYFYPASTVKMPVAFAAVKKAQELGIAIDAPLLIDSTRVYPRRITWDSTLNAPLTIRNQIEKIFAVSDNSAYNILYGWLGQDYINQLYNEAGIKTRIVHQLGESAFSFTPLSNTYSRQMRIIRTLDTLVFNESKQNFSSQSLLHEQKKGKGFIDSLGNLINQPFDFSKKNYVPLEGLLKTLEAGTRPDLFKTNEPFNFKPTYQQALLDAMNRSPKDLTSYDTVKDNYVKFLGYGNEPTGKIPDPIKIKNKVGWAYGYLLDVSYLEDTEQKVSFFLAAVILVNENQIYNDGNYEYQEIGLPFLDELGDLVYQYELSKKLR